MAHFQLIAFHAPKQDYFAGYLQDIITASGIKAGVDMKDDYIRLVIHETDPKTIETFSENLGKWLPFSIFMGKMHSGEDDLAPLEESFKAHQADISLCPRCIAKLFSPDSPDYLNPNLVCDHYNAEVTPKSFPSTDWDALIADLASGKPVLLGERTFTQEPTPLLFIADSTKLGELLNVTAKEIQVLQSIEKPILKCAIKDEALKAACGRNFIRVMLFDDAPTAILAKKLKDSGSAYCFVRPFDGLEVSVNKDDIRLINAPRLHSLEAINPEDTLINRFANMVEEFDLGPISSLGAYAPANMQCEFILRSAKVSKRVISFLTFDAEGILERIAAVSDAKARLVANFEAHHPEAHTALSSGHHPDLFAAICAVLGISGNSYEAVADTALAFMGSGGVKVDVKFDSGSFDYDSLIASLMSFRLAGVENSLLCYSLFESLADMFVDTLTHLHQRFKCTDFILMGELAAYPAFSDRVAKRAGKLVCHISKRHPLDD